MSPSQRPQLILAPSISTTKVVTTTTTTTTYEPITLPPLPTPSTPKNAKDFPLYHAELPASVRQFPLVFPNGTHATFSDGGPLPASSSSNPAHSEAGGQYWRQLRRDEQSDSSKVVGLAEAVEKFGRKRSHVTAEADMMEGVESATQQDSHGTLHAFSSPPRKKARGLTLPPLSTAVGGAAPPSPLPSPNGSPSPTMQPECVWPAAVTPPNESVPSSPPLSQSQIQHPQQPTPPIQPDLALTTLLSLPNLVSHFSALPPALQSHFLLTLLRHSPLSVLRTLHGVLTPTLARDFLTILPPELVSTILSFLPYATLARASRVSKAWRAIVDSDPVLWRDLLQDTRIWFGGDSERAFARAIYARRRRLGLPGPSELPMPHPYKLLFTSRHLTRTRWQAQTAPVHKTFPAHGVSVVTCLLFSRGRVISASDDHSIHVYSPVTGELLRALDGHEGGVWALAATGDTLVSGSTDRTVRIWDLSTGRCTHVFGGHTSTVRCLSVVKPEWVEMEDGTREKWPKRSVIVTGSRDHSLRVWNLPRKGEGEYKCYGAEDGDVDPEEDDVEANPYHLRHLEGHEHAVRALAARGRTLVSGSYDCTVRVWDIITGKCKWTLTGHQQKVYSVVYDPGRKQACSGSMDGTVRIWSLTNGTCLHTLMGHTSLVGLLGLSPSSLVSAAADSTLRIWDPDTGALRHTLSGHTGAITCFQHDEFKVLSGSDGTLKMWDIRDGAPVRNLLTGIIGVWQVVFEGRWCVAASNRNDQTWLDVWDFGREGDHGWIGESPSGMYDEDSEGEDSDEEEEDEMLELKEEERVRRRREKEKAREDAMDEDEEERPEELSEPEVDEELGVEAHLTEPEHEEYHRRHHASIPAKSQDQQLRNTSWGSSALSAGTAHALARALPPVEETPTKPRGKGSTRRR